MPIRGLLLGPDGRPLAGAAVRLAALYVPWKKDLTAHPEKRKSRKAPSSCQDHDRSLETPGVLPGVTTEAVTDTDGRFRLAGLGRDRLAHLRIRGPGVVDTAIEVMTRYAPDVHVRPLGIAGRSRHLRGQLHAHAETGPHRDGRGPRQGDGHAAGGCLDWPGMSIALDGLMTGHYPHATDARGQFADLGDPHRSLQETSKVLAVPKPGQPYFLARAVLTTRGEAVVDCPRGIPFRLTLRDEAGRPVEADVTYSAIAPNPSFAKVSVHPGAGRIAPVAGRAAGRRLVPGRGAAGAGRRLAKTPRKAGYRPAHVDPKAFFAPGKTDWTPQELISTYGNHDTLSVATFYGGAWDRPARLRRDRPRQSGGGRRSRWSSRRRSCPISPGRLRCSTPRAGLSSVRSRPG